MFRISVTTRNLDIEREITDYLNKHLRRSLRYFSEIISVHASLYKERGQFCAEITLNGDGFTLHANERNKKDIYLTTDKAIDKAKEQLRRHREKLRERKRRSRHSSKSIGQTQRIESRRVDQEPISLEEAILRLSLREEPFLAFINSNSNQLNVVYKRGDGEYGLIYP
jgi:putative sigma-54 modulation protein